MVKPKIFHIGGAHSAHVADLVIELDKRGYSQCVLSYKKESIIPRHIPVYKVNYQKFYPNRSFPKDEQQLRLIIQSILKKEKPNILHGHFLIFSCVALGIARDLSNLPTFLSPWSTRALTKDKILLSRIDKCIKNASAFLTDKISFFRLFQTVYNVNLKDHMYQFFRLPLDLSRFHSIDISTKDFSVPRILSARVMGETYHQDLLIKALPKIFNKHGNATATFIIGQNASQGRPYFNQMIALAKSLGIYNKCSFINKGLSQQEFSDLISRHNIVYSVCEDPGCAQTTIQAAYSGAITIERENNLVKGVLDHDINILLTALDVKSVEETLNYAIDNIKELSIKFFNNNRKLKEHSTEFTLPRLISLYNKEIKI